AISGRVFELVPHGDDAGFTMTEIARLPGRVRDALLLGDRVLAVSRSGHLHELRATEAGLTDTVILHEASGLGRITRRPRTAPQQPEVVYVTRDDGVLLRLEEVGAGEWRREVVFVGSQGPRGVAAGRFQDRKSTRLNSSHVKISYAVFCLKKKKQDLKRHKLMLRL